MAGFPVIDDAGNEILSSISQRVDEVNQKLDDTLEVIVINQPDSTSSDGATATNQTTGNNSLDSINTKLDGSGTLKTKQIHDPIVSGHTSNTRRVAVSGNNNSSLHGAAVLINAIYGYNNTDVVKYIHLGNIGTATIGTTVPTFTLALSPRASAQFNGNGEMRFGTGLAYWFTNDIDGLDTAGVASKDLLMYISYTKA